MQENQSQFKREVFAKALEGVNLPILTLDNKWYRLLSKLDRESVKSLEDELNSLLKRQGKLNTDTKEIRKRKKQLMNEIVPMVNELEQSHDSALEKKIEDNKKLIEACNLRLDEYREELLDLPKQINNVNFKLMLMTMEYCYLELQTNTNDINQIDEWLTDIRIQLKKNLVKKQEMEHHNHTIYSYMHDIFGSQVLEMFDMQYNPEEKHPRVPDAEER